MSRGSLSRWGVCPGGSLSKEDLSRVGKSLSGGGLCQGDPSYGNELAVRIILECILVRFMFSRSSSLSMEGSF